MKILKVLISSSIKSAAALALATGSLFSQPVFAQQTGFIGEIRFFAGNFAPRGWAFCDGQLISINDNQALFAVIGTTYGGDGRNNFALPDLRSRMPMHPGTGAGLSTRRLGERGGRENQTLLNLNLPSHNHSSSLVVSTADADTVVPSLTPVDPSDGLPDNAPQHALAVQKIPLQNNAGSAGFTTNTPTVPITGLSVGNTGQSQPFQTISPFLNLNCIIATEGVFPSRS